MYEGRRHRPNTGNIGTPAVLFVDDSYWDCFAQFAVGLRRAGIRAIRVTTRPPLPGSRRFIFDRTIHLHAPDEFDRLSSLLDGEQLIDVQTVESLAVPTVRGLRSTDPSPAPRRWDGRALIVDKPTAACRMQTAGIHVPDIITDPTATPDEIISTLGLPVVRKLRTGSSGDGVSIIETRRELESTSPDDRTASKFFYERFIDGRHIQFAGIVNADMHNQSVTYETLNRFSTMGPASEIRVLDDTELRKTGLQVAEALDLSGMVNVNVIRDAEGQDWVHDVNPRIWGSAVSFRLVGVDFLGAYISWLSDVETARSETTPPEGAEFQVFPVAYATTRPDESAFHLSRRFARAARPFADYLGPTYVLYESVRRIGMGIADAFPPLRRTEH